MSAGFVNFRSALPQQLQQVLQAVDTMSRAGNMKGAMRAADEAVARGLEHPTLLALAAYEQINRGDFDKALAHADHARELAPRNADALNAAGLALLRLNRPQEALRLCDQALRQAPGVAQVHFNRACCFEALHDFKQARIGFERTVGLQAEHWEALARLSGLAALGGDVAATRDYAERSLRLNPRGAAAKLALATADIEADSYSDALARLRDFAQRSDATTIQLATAKSLEADAFDGLERCAEAFAAYTQGNAVLRNIYRSLYEVPGQETAPARVARLTEYFRSASPEAWQPSGEDSTKPVNTHAFLVGFPRSGTTLLERILDAHPAIEAMPEKECLTDAAHAFMGSKEDLDRLATASASDLDKFRALYWQRVGEFGLTPSRPVFIDKMPLNIVQLCLLAKLFPAAKVLIILRDPRDVVLSCFRRRFGMTPQMYQLLTLEGTARYYDAVMQLQGAYCQTLTLPVLYLRYEDVVADFEGALRKVCDFLDVTWNESLADFASHAKGIHISTPSAAQIARGLYSYGVGQWRRYEDQLASVMPILAPWISRLEYN